MLYGNESRGRGVVFSMSLSFALPLLQERKMFALFCFGKNWLQRNLLQAVGFLYVEVG